MLGIRATLQPQACKLCQLVRRMCSCLSEVYVHVIGSEFGE